MNQIYRQIRSEYYDKGISLPEDKLKEIIAGTMGQYDKGLPPPAAQSFPWYEIQTTLLQYKDSYFKSDDILVFDLSQLGFDKLTVANYSEVLDTVAFNLRSQLDTLRKEDKDVESPVPFFDMTDLSVTESPRKFKYTLAVSPEASNRYATLPDPSTDPFALDEKVPELPSDVVDEPSTQPDSKKSDKKSESVTILEAETKKIQAETELVKEQTKLASLQLEKANKALELISKGFNIDQVNKLLGL